jgi:quercetin dioxygenase-like cupin family protein
MPIAAQFIRFHDVPAFTLIEGVEGRSLCRDGAMVNPTESSPGTDVPTHSHPHEQLEIPVRGMEALVIDGVARELGPMEGYLLPGHVEHSAHCGPDGETVFAVFCPAREDYRERWEDSSAANG